VLTAITFITQYYPEDNEFTDKFSLSLGSRLRRINVHQVNIFILKSIFYFGNFFFVLDCSYIRRIKIFSSYSTMDSSCL